MGTKKKKVGAGQWVLTGSMGLYALICLLPVLLVAVVSFSSNESVQHKGFTFFPESWSLKAWEYIADYGTQLVTSYKVTIIITVVGTALSLVIMGMFAYSLSRSVFRLRGFLSILLLITMLFNGGQLSRYIIYSSMYHLKNTYAVLILPGCVTAMNVIILRTYIQSNVPEALVESAKMDGAGEFRSFWQIVFPMMKPALASVGFMRAVNIWNEWQDAYLFINDDARTPLQLLLILIEKNIDYALNNAKDIPAAEYMELIKNLPQETCRMAMLLTALGPIMVAYPFFQKYFVKGLTVGAVKG